MSSKKIVCLSTSPWFPHPTRKQQVMSRIEDAEILYFDPPVTFLAPLRDSALKPKLKAYREAPVYPKEGIKVFSLPPILPFFNRFRFINRLNQKKLARFITDVMAREGFDNPVLWVYSPMYADIAGKIPNNALVYDCVDRHSAYKGQINPALVDQMEADLAASSDAVFCTAAGLHTRLSAFNQNCFMIPNGADFEKFNAVETQKPRPPDDIARLNRPVLGFVGVMRVWVDTKAIEFAARSRPEWSFVMIGPEGDADLAGLKSLKNVHFLGPKPHDEIPGYISGFDVCLNAFAASDLSKDVSPLKFYEYLATGRPVVSTSVPLQVQDYADCVYIADTPEEYLSACREAVAESGDEMKNRRIAAARAASWDARVAEIVEKCSDLNIFGG